MTQSHSPKILRLAADDSLYGRMNDPTGAAFFTGACGDDMEFYLVVSGGRIFEARYYTERGCEVTRACGATVVKFANGRGLEESLSISAGDVLMELGEVPASHRHCAILAVITFYKAVADVLLKP